MNGEELKSSALNFRVPGSFRAEIDALSVETGWPLADICRMGLLVFWPEIKEVIRAGGPQSGEAPHQLREYIRICHTAKAHGIDPKLELTRAIERGLEQAVVCTPELAAGT